MLPEFPRSKNPMISSPFRSIDNQNEDEEVILVAQEGRQNLSVWNGRGGGSCRCSFPTRNKIDSKGGTPVKNQITKKNVCFAHCLPPCKEPLSN